jgi:hypothetical protein
MAAAKPKVNAATQAVRDARAVSKAAGVKYVKKAEVKVNAATQASRVARATINNQAAKATAAGAANKVAATDAEGNVGEYVQPERPARYVRPAAPANKATQVIRNDRAKIKAAGGRYARSTSGLSKEAIALRKNAGVNERLVSLRNSKRSIPKKTG